MSAMDIAIPLLRQHEGLRLTPYKCTADALTIGYGRNLDAKGITLPEAEMMLRTDSMEAETDAQIFCGPAWPRLNEVRRAVVIDMAFNLGLTRLSKFRNFQAQLFIGNYEGAAQEMLNSRWAYQVGGRADHLSRLMREGHI